MPRSLTPEGRQNGTPRSAAAREASVAQRVVTLLLIVLAATAGMYSLAMPDSVPDTAPGDEFSAQRAMSHVEAIAQKPHPMGSSANARVRDYLADQLAAMGLQTDVQTTTVPDYFGVNQNGDTVALHNVAARLPGTRSKNALALMGHYDSVPAAPGASDDGAAVAAILETARALQASPPLQNDVILLFTDGEEPGQFRHGAKAFVDQHPWAQDIALVLNFEASGCSGPSTLFETGPTNGRLIREFGLAAPHPVAFSYWNDLYKTIAKGGTDYSRLEEAGIAGLNFAFFFKRTVYHTALDNVENLDPRSLQHHGSHALALARHFGNLDLGDFQRPGNGDAVYFSLFGRILVHYPASSALPLAILAGALLTAVVVLGLKRKRLRGPHLALAVLAYPLGVVATVVLLSIAWWAIDRLHLAHGHVMEPTYQAHFYLIGVLCLATAALCAVSTLLQRKAQPANLQVGVLLCCWILALLSNLYLPGFSYLFTWPLLASLLAMAWMLYQEPRDSNSWRRIAILALGGAPALILLTPTVYSLFQAMGIPSPGFSGSPSFPIIGVSLFFWMLLAGLLLPHLELMTGRHRWRLIAVMLLVAITFVAAGSLTPGIAIEDFGLGNVG